MERLKFIIKTTIKQLIGMFIITGALGLYIALEVFLIQQIGFIKTLIIAMVGHSVIYSVILAFLKEGKE